MNKIQAFILMLFVLSVPLLSGCEDETEEPKKEVAAGVTFSTTGTLKMGFTHQFRSKDLKFSPDTFITLAQDTIRITDLMYYVSNVRLVRPDGSVWNAANFDLLNGQAGTDMVNLSGIPAGNYTKIRFLIGVDEVNNHTLNHNEPDLDPSLGMSWGWSTGYIFYRMKGYHSSSLKGFSFDLGGDAHLMEVTFDISSYKLAKDQVQATVNVDVNKFFEDPNTYNLKAQTNTIHTPTEPEIPLFTANIKNGMFQLKNIE